MAKEACSVADGLCTAPANYDGANTRAKCFSCGQPVCPNCSSRRKYYNYGQVRLCNNCQVGYDGNDRRVLRRLYTLRGR